MGEVVLWGTLVKFSHTIFALPFALSIFALLAFQGRATISQFLLILVALVSARTSAMAFNRVVDRRIDAKNPRTTSREIPRGAIEPRSVWILCALSTAAFLLASAALGLHCLVLSPLVVAVLLGYSLTKRFTRYSHLVLGAALALAPGGVWYALTGTVAWVPVVLMIGVALWVAGFDVLYSCQDVEFDRREGLRSIPAALGVHGAFRVAWYCHILAIVAFSAFGVVVGFGWLFQLALAPFVAVLLSQHRIISPTDLSRINAAFFTRNGVASVLFFGAVIVGCLAQR